jgi:hypothetical protein
LSFILLNFGPFASTLNKVFGDSQIAFHASSITFAIIKFSQLGTSVTLDSNTHSPLLITSVSLFVFKTIFTV